MKFFRNSNEENFIFKYSFTTTYVPSLKLSKQTEFNKEFSKNLTLNTSFDIHFIYLYILLCILYYKFNR